MRHKGLFPLLPPPLFNQRLSPGPYCSAQTMPYSEIKGRVFAPPLYPNPVTLLVLNHTTAENKRGDCP